MKKHEHSLSAVKQEHSPWQLQTAKARFSELFRRARTEGPQIVTRQGTEKVVVLPAEYFERLTKQAHQPKTLVQFFAQSPLAGIRLDFNWPKESGRKIKI
jgi:antitoxin Phd